MNCVPCRVLCYRVLGGVGKLTTTNSSTHSAKINLAKNADMSWDGAAYFWSIGTTHVKCLSPPFLGRRAFSDPKRGDSWFLRNVCTVPIGLDGNRPWDRPSCLHILAVPQFLNTQQWSPGWVISFRYRSACITSYQIMGRGPHLARGALASGSWNKIMNLIISDITLINAQSTFLYEWFWWLDSLSGPGPHRWGLIYTLTHHIR